MNEFLNAQQVLSERDKLKLNLPAQETEDSTLNLTMVKVERNTPEYENAIPIKLNGNETEEEIRQLILDRLPDFFWHQKPEWKELGQPLEVVKLQLESGRTIELYNWLRPLTEKELGELQEVIGIFATIDVGKAIETLGYILIKNMQPEWTLKTGDDVNGYGSINQRRDQNNGIRLYPHAFEGTHRAAQISNFKGTIIHETTHHLAPGGRDIVNEWENTFGWQSKDRTDWQVQDPDRCITEYAKTSPEEDICDSIVAKLGDNPSLDSEKSRFLDERLLSKKISNDIVKTEHSLGESVKMPELPRTIHYREASKFTIQIDDQQAQEVQVE